MMLSFSGVVRSTLLGVRMSIVTRFAPSPTGYLHLGHAWSALFAWRRARAAGGRFLLRIEDIDPARCRPEFAAAIEEDLAWLGLDWDGEVRVQSAHLPEYRAVLDGLTGRGLLYPCFCTRADIQREIGASASAPHAPDGSAVYPGICRDLADAERARRIAAGERYALRLDMARALARKDAPASYHLCVTHDDAVQGVTLVTRGEDLKPATDLHRLLQALMGFPPPRYAHHRLLTDAAGRRLAKRDQAMTLRALREQGVAPQEVWQMTDGLAAGSAGDPLAPGNPA
jgi:glutamyl-Q tRNA(Asp) synthetase